MANPRRAGLDFSTLQAHLNELTQLYAPRPWRAASGRQSEPVSIYQLKITLRHIRPPIWRRVQVSSNITLARLHALIQTVMGWTDSHLHCFEANDVLYSLPDSVEDLNMKDSRRVRLAEVAPGEKAKIKYEYDFGDSWYHDIVVEKVLPPDPAFEHPVCLAGRRACPPEDVGGPGGFIRFLKVLADPDDPEHEEMLEWYGDDFDADAFDLDAINRGLQVMKW